MVLWRLDIFAFLQARLSLCSSTMRSVLIFHVLIHLLQRRLSIHCPDYVADARFMCLNDKPTPAETSSTMRALQRALVYVIITLLNDSKRSLNKKMAAPSNKQIKSPHLLEIKAKLLPTFSLNCSISNIHTKKHASSFR